MTAQAVPGRTRPALLAGIVLAVALPAAADADSLVYVKDANVWISRSDGTGARQVTSSANNWAWPSVADDGTIFVAGGRARVNADGSRAQAGSEIHRFDQAGARIGPPVPTPGSRSTPACPTDAPAGVRVSPNGRRVAFDALFCDERDSLWQDLSDGNVTVISQEYGSSGWLDDEHVLITHVGPTLEEESYAVYELATAETRGPLDLPFLTERQAAASRDGSRVAVYEDEPNLDGTIASAGIRLFETVGGDVAQPVQRCTIAIAAREATELVLASPTFSPDGTKLAWVQKDGVHVADTANLDDCRSLSPTLLVPDADHPFFAAANVAANAGAVNARRRRNALTISSATKRARLTSSGVLTFVVKSSRSATAVATGTIRLPRSARPVRFARRTRKLRERTPTRVTLRLSPRGARVVRGALARSRLAATITVTARTPSGERARKRLVIRLRR